ncbi:MAG: hypothetical protein ACYSUQ_10410, partial [Planctomycetota bacterium]
KRVRESAKRTQDGDDKHILLSPDRFAAGLASMLSEGVFSGRRPYRDDHPDTLVEVGWSQSITAESRHLAKPGSVSVDPLEITDYVFKKTLPTRNQPDTDFEPLDGAKPGHEYWVATLTPNADAEDVDGEHRFALPQIRLVGADASDRPVQYIPCAIRDEHDPEKHVREIHDGRRLQSPLLHMWHPDEDGTIEVVFEVPKDFQPRYIAYKSGARAEVTAPTQEDIHLPPPSDETTASAAGGDDEEEPDSSTVSSSDRRRRSGSRRAGSRRSRDRVSGARAREGGSFFGEELPLELTLTDYSGREIEVHREMLESGHVVAVLGFQGERDTEAHITGFEIPAGKKLLHLRVDVLRARSGLGRALSYSVRTIRNYLITDDAGKQYEMVGQYALADVDGDDVVEIQYFPEQIGSMGRGVRRFTEIKDRHLKQGDTTLVYLYLIDEGRKVVRFTTGSSASRAVDLSDDDLVAE